MDTSIVSLLADNSDTVMNDAKDVLLKLLGNILGDPNNMKYRAVKLTNKVIEEKLLAASGAFEILFSGIMLQYRNLHKMKNNVLFQLVLRKLTINLFYPLEQI